MATLNITEFQQIAKDPQGYRIPMVVGPYAKSQNVTYTTAQTATLKGNTKVVRFIADADAYLTFSGTATNSSMRLEANVAEYFAVSGGETVSVYDGTS